MEEEGRSDGGDERGNVPRNRSEEGILRWRKRDGPLSSMGSVAAVSDGDGVLVLE